jgi:hypothetical protein
VKTYITKTCFRRAGERTPRGTSSVREQIFCNSRGIGGVILPSIISLYCWKFYIHALHTEELDEISYLIYNFL